MTKSARSNPAQSSAPGAVLAALLLACWLPAAGQAQRVIYAGSATSHGAAGSIDMGGVEGIIELNVPAQGTVGYLTINAPLAGTGDVRFQAWADTVLFISTGANGDTIAWLGTRHGRTLSGEFITIGGSKKGQGGRWRLSRLGNAADVAAGKRVNVALLHSAMQPFRDLVVAAPVPAPAPDLPAEAAATAAAAAAVEAAPGTAESPARQRGVIFPAVLLLLLAGAVAFAGAYQLRTRKRRRYGDRNFGALCSHCNAAPITAAKNAWYVRGSGFSARFGSKTIIGCDLCVARVVHGAMTVSLKGWRSFPSVLALPVVAAQNIVQLLLPADPQLVEDELRKAGLDPAELRIDANGFSREQRRILDATAYVLATVAFSSPATRTRDLERAAQLLRQFSNDRISADKAASMLAHATRRAGHLNALDLDVRQTLFRMALNMASVHGRVPTEKIATVHALAEKLDLPRDYARARLLEMPVSLSAPQDNDVMRASAILGVSVDAALVDVTQAWRTALLHHQPDRTLRDAAMQEAQQRFTQEIIWAYGVLREHAVTVQSYAGVG